MRFRPRSDSELEEVIGVTKNDLPGRRVGRVYSRDHIRAIEEQMVPWLRDRRRRGKWDEQHPPSS